MSNQRGPLANVRDTYSWDFGGGVELDVIELDDGTVLLVSDEAISLYPSAEALDDGEPSLVAIARPSGDILHFD